MGAPRADIDRASIAASVALHGQRETARRTGVPLGTVQRIAKEAGAVPPSPLTRVIRTTAIGTSGTVGTPAHAVITDELSARGSSSRLNAARIGDATLAVIASEPAERQIPLLGSANEAASLLVKGNVPGWERKAEQQAQQVVNIALLGAELPQITETAIDSTLPSTVHGSPIQDGA